MRGLDSETVLRKTEKGRIECFTKQYQKYSNGELIRLHFVKSVWYKFGALKDLQIHMINVYIPAVLVVADFILFKILLPSPRGEQGATGVTWLLTEEVSCNIIIT
jgi:hypothetical protein